MKKISVIVSLFLAMVSPSVVSAQESSVDTTGYNPLSVRPVHESDIMYKKSLLRALDLREKQNQPLFSKNREITKLIIDAVVSGDITPYYNDSLNAGSYNGNGQLTITEFQEKMLIPNDQPALDSNEIAIMLANGDSSALQSNVGAQYFFPTDLYQMEIKEDILFDKQRSRMYFDIHAITIKVPADHPSNIKGIEIPVASFKYVELVNKLFKDNPNAIWYNPQNDEEHHELADAFELRLFSSYIIKVSNPKDAYLVDIYGGDLQKGIMASHWAAFELLEYEHNMWEF
jgi:gliding motility associated protien GldN